MKCLFSFTPKVGRSGEVVRVFLTEKHSTNAGRGIDRRCGRVCQLTLEDGLWRRGVRRAGVRAIDADVSICRSCAAEAAKALAATDAELRQSLIRQACLSAARGKGALCATFVGATDARPRCVGRVCCPGVMQASLDRVCRSRGPVCRPATDASLAWWRSVAEF
jgi:hypothetical protein